MSNNGHFIEIFKVNAGVSSINLVNTPIAETVRVYIQGANKNLRDFTVSNNTITFIEPTRSNIGLINGYDNIMVVYEKTNTINVTKTITGSFNSEDINLKYLIYPNPAPPYSVPSIPNLDNDLLSGDVQFDVRHAPSFITDTALSSHNVNVADIDYTVSLHSGGRIKVDWTGTQLDGTLAEGDVFMLTFPITGFNAVKIIENFELDYTDTYVGQIILDDLAFPDSSASIIIEVEGAPTQILNYDWGYVQDYGIDRTVINWLNYQLGGYDPINDNYFNVELEPADKIKVIYHTYAIDLPIKQIVQFTDINRHGLAPRLRTTVRRDIWQTSKTSIPSEQAIREALDDLPTGVDLWKTCNVKEPLFAQDNRSILEGIVSTGTTGIIERDLVFRPFEAEGNIYLVESDNYINVVTKMRDFNAAPLSGGINLPKVSVQGGKHQKTNVLYEFKADSDGDTIAIADKGDIIGKIFLKVLTEFKQTSAFYSIGIDSDQEKYIKKFKIGGGTGLLENWQYGDSYFSHEYIYVDTESVVYQDNGMEHDGEYMKLYCSDRAPANTDLLSADAYDDYVATLPGKLGISIFYDKIYNDLNYGYVFQGTNGVNGASNNFIEKLNFSQNTINATSSSQKLANPKHHFASLYDGRGSIYIMGGIKTQGARTNQGEDRSIERYFVNTDTISNINSSMALSGIGDLGRDPYNIYFFAQDTIEQREWIALTGDPLQEGYFEITGVVTGNIPIVGIQTLDFIKLEKATTTMSHLYIPNPPSTDQNFMLSGFGFSGMINDTTLQDEQYLGLTVCSIDSDLIAIVGPLNYYSDSSYVTRIYKFDPTTQSIQLSEDYLKTRRSGTKCINRGSKRFNIVGGITNDVDQYGSKLISNELSCEMIDFTNSVVRAFASFPLVKVAFGSIVQNNIAAFYCGGFTKYVGYDATGLADTNSTQTNRWTNIVQKLDFATNTWGVVNTRLAAKHLFGSAASTFNFDGMD